MHKQNENLKKKRFIFDNMLPKLKYKIIVTPPYNCSMILKCEIIIKKCNHTLWKMKFSCSMTSRGEPGGAGFNVMPAHLRHPETQAPTGSFGIALPTWR